MIFWDCATRHAGKGAQADKSRIGSCWIRPHQDIHDITAPTIGKDDEQQRSRSRGETKWGTYEASK
eukprot:scaffold299_cov343-Prasinococcus_capsulatus_cf.AAC.15